MINRIANGRTDLVFNLVAERNSADIRDENGVSVMQWCAYYGDVSAIRYLMSCGATLGLLGDNLDLHGAAYHGHWQLCEFLIAEGADVNYALVDSGETPLHAALCKANRPAYNLVLRVLLANGARANQPTKNGVETGSFMRDCRTRGETPLHRAAAFGDAEAIQLLLDAGAVVNAVDAHGDTPLSWASWHLRPGLILQKLCFGAHTISPAGVVHYAGDHGMGWGGLEASLRGKPQAQLDAAPDVS